MVKDNAPFLRLLVVGLLLSSIGSIKAQVPPPQCLNGGCPPSSSPVHIALPSSLAPNSLGLFQTFSLPGDYLVAGVGVRGTGQGIISVTGVPTGATIAAAYLYWETLGDGQQAAFRGISITGTPLGTVASPCWPEPTITVYRFDVLSLLPLDSNRQPIANGSHTVRFPDSGNFNVAPSTEGASLVIVYRRSDLPTRLVLLYDGAFTLPVDGHSVDGSSFNLLIPFPPASTAPAARVSQIVGDGQDFYDELYFNGALFGTHIFDGQLGPLWDSPTFNVGALISPGDSQFTIFSPITGDCLTWAAVVFSIVNPQPAIQITLVPQPTNDTYIIDDTPTMPKIQAQAKVINVSPDPTPTTTFTWKATLVFTPPCGSIGTYSSDIVQPATTTGQGTFTLTFTNLTAFRGGSLQLTATATVNGKQLQGVTPSDLAIKGTNPQRSTLQSYIDSLVPSTGFAGLQVQDIQDVLKRIACHESSIDGIHGQRQFRAAADGGIGVPITSTACDGGVGAFQITSGDPVVNAPNDAFNWQSNTAAGEAHYNGNALTAQQYPGNLPASRGFKDFIDAINQTRMANGLKKLPGFPAPQFTTSGVIGSNPPNQLLEDATRGYNGYAGHTPWGGVLHEFIPDKDFLLTVPDSELPGIHNNPLVWRRVLPQERPQNGGYVIPDVSSQSPQCGG